MNISPAAMEHYNRGTRLMREGELAAAVSAFDDAIELCSIFQEALSNRGLAKVQLRQTRRGLDDLNAAVALDPTDIYALMNRGQTYMLIEEWASAIDDFSRVLGIRPDDPSTHVAYPKRAQSHEKLGQFTRAIQDWRSALAKSEDPTVRSWIQERIRKLEEGTGT